MKLFHLVNEFSHIEINLTSFSDTLLWKSIHRDVLICQAFALITVNEFLKLEKQQNNNSTALSRVMTS